jgi:hypothetical protein
MIRSMSEDYVDVVLVETFERLVGSFDYMLARETVVVWTFAIRNEMRSSE